MKINGIKVGTGIQTGGAKGSWTPAGNVVRPTAPRGFGGGGWQTDGCNTA